MNIKLVDAGVVRFYKSFPDMVAARRISDHVPVWAEFDFEVVGEEDLRVVVPANKILRLRFET